MEFCRKTKHFFLVNKPTEKELSEYYTNDYYDFLQKNKVFLNLKYLFSSIRGFSQFKYISNYFKSKKGKVLEIGGGTGSLLSYFKRNGWDVTGLEFNSFMRKNAKHKLGINLENIDIFDFNKKGFDLIIMSHVLEHFLDMGKVLEHSKKLLNRGGVIYIEVPDSPLPQYVSKKALVEYLNTSHIFNFSPKFILKLISIYDFKIEKINKAFYRIPKLFTKNEKEIAESIAGVKLNFNKPLIALESIISCLYLIILFILKKDPFIELNLNKKVKSNCEFIRAIIKTKYKS